MTKEITNISPYAIPGLKGRYKFKFFVSSGDMSSYIQEIVLNEFGLTLSSVSKRGRRRECVLSRQIIYWLKRRYTSDSLKQMGRVFGQDHTTVLHAVQTINDQMETDEHIRQVVQKLEGMIQ